LIVLGAMVWLVCGQRAEGQATRPQPVVLNAHSGIDEILQALYARGYDLQDFSAKVSKTSSDATLTKETTYLGTIRYQRQNDGNVRIRVTFDHKKLGDLPQMAYHSENELENGMLTVQDYEAKLENHFRVAPVGQKVNPLRLGEGAFPLPIGQEPAAVKKDFDLKLVPADKDDPANTIHAQLIPRPDTKLGNRFKTIDVWVDTKTNFTPRIVTLDKNEVTATETNLTDLKVNSGLGDKDFQLPTPPKDWVVKPPEQLEE
jgi:outer membrane lipoprotein-sorting protein